MTTVPEREYWPTADWELPDHEEVGVDVDRLAELDAYAADNLAQKVAGRDHRPLHRPGPVLVAG